MRDRTYGGVRGRKTKVGRKLLRFPPTRLVIGENGIKNFYFFALLNVFCNFVPDLENIKDDDETAINT